MKHPLLPLVVVVVLALMIAAFSFLHTAAGATSFIPTDARQPALIAGISCLVLAVGVLVFGMITYRKVE